MEETEQTQKQWLDRPVLNAFPAFSREKLIIALIILLTIISRFAILGNRVMSHDEVNHVVPSYSLYSGNGYVHDPITHGPLQFHLVALSYFLLGDNDFSSRVPAAIFSIAAVIFVLFGFRKYLGRIGSLIGGFLFLISPFLLYYGRYTRNEAFIELFAVLTFYGILRYFSKRDNFSLYLLAVVTALQFTTKEVAYIYTAQLLLFCGFVFLYDVWNFPWEEIQKRTTAFALLLFGALIGAVGLLLLKYVSPESGADFRQYLGMGLLAIGALLVIIDIISVIRQFGWQIIRKSPAFNLIVFIGALILPLLTAFPVRLMGWDPLDYSSAGIIHTGIVMIVLFVISFLIGIWWNRDVFLKSLIAFYLIFITFYTTLFSNGHGFFTGMVGSLGYWLTQQDVQRGSQPLYYYAAILIPIYEYAAVAGSILGIFFAAKHHLFWAMPTDNLYELTEAKELPETNNAARVSEGDEIRADSFGDDENMDLHQTLSIDFIDNLESLHFEIEDNEPIEKITEIDELSSVQRQSTVLHQAPSFLLFLFWGLTALAAYSFAGEKMPWLTVHITLPLSLAAAWGIGFLLEKAPWQKIASAKGLIALAALICGTFALSGLLSSLFGPNPAFVGKTLDQLKATNQFIFSAIAFLLVLFVLFRTWKGWSGKDILTSVVIYFVALLCILEARTAYTASFIHYDYANELLVYAHAAPGPKIVLRQIEEIGARTGEGKSIKVAYDNDALYPYWWYFRDYPNKYYFGEENPTRELRNYDVIIANTSKDSRLIPIVRDEYYRFETIRLWWPNQDYFNLTWDRIRKSLGNPQMRSALFDIWLNRDYSQYAQVTGKNTFRPDNWDPSARMVVYMRKDLLKKMYQLGDTALLPGSTTEEEGNVTEDDKFTQLDPVLSIGSEGTGPGQFNNPRNVAVAQDGTIYVLDSDNQRVQYFSPSGEYLGMWDAKEQGGFNQPWGIAVSPEGEVFVADTWNHRIMKFSSKGEFLLQWYANDPTEPNKTFYGPRALAVDTMGEIYISDTGNKRILIYSTDGTFIAQFGTAGTGVGELDEPVGIAVWHDQLLAVADTWNQRVQIFDVSGEAPSFAVVGSFDIAGWYSQSLDNKPYLAFDKDGNILVTDPEGYLVMQYSREGKLLRSWNGGGGDIDNFSMPTGITVDSEGAIWVVDTANDRVNKFILPAADTEQDQLNNEKQ